MSASWEDEITELIPRTMLTQLQALSRRPAVVVTAPRLPPRPGACDDELHRDDFVDEESPSTLISLADLERVQSGLPVTDMSCADLELVRQAIRAAEIALADFELQSTDVAVDDLEVVQSRAASSLADLELVRTTRSSTPHADLADRDLVQVAVRSTETARVGLELVARAVRSTEIALADFELVEHATAPADLDLVDQATELALDDVELIEAVTAEVSHADLERIREAIRSTEVSLACLELAASPRTEGTLDDPLEARDGGIEVSLADLDVIDASPDPHVAPRAGALLVTGLITLGGGLVWMMMV